jgi:hypothetical protein
MLCIAKYTAADYFGSAMISHIHDALAQVRRLQEVVLSRRFFQGYSGKARILSGTTALLGAWVLSRGLVPATPQAHLLAWLTVVGIALLLNYGALVHWILAEPKVRQRPVILKPALDAVPALAVGGLLTLALVRAGAHDLLFGVWMCCFGVAHLAYRQSLPGENYLVGLFYVACGAVCLLAPGVRFTSPWPMGIVFFAGELAGGLVLMLMNNREKDLELL